MAKIIGIDLGTTNSCMGLMEDNRLLVIPNDENFRTTPSVVAFTKEGQILVGNAAKRQQVMNPENTIFSIKRFIGRKFNDPTVANDLRLMPYKLIKAANGDVWVEVMGRTYSPPELSAMILMKMKKDAENYLGETVDKAVVTVPAHFNDSQRQATKDAGKIAGLEIVRIINEPTAAALASGFDSKTKMKVVIYDLGGGTFDVSILELGQGIFKVLSTSGDTHLGGDDFDQAIIDYLVAEFLKKEGIDLKNDRVALQRLKDAAEKAKINLSTLESVEITLPFLAATNDGPKHLQTVLSRPTLEAITKTIAEKTAGPCEIALNDAGMRAGDIDEVVLVGGQTKMPLVREVVKRIFRKDPFSGVNPDEAVASGASKQASVLKGDIRDILLLDVTAFSLGIKTEGGIFSKIVEKNSSIPLRKTEVYTTTQENQSFVRIEVFQGEKPMASDNKMIGTFDLVGIPPGPKGSAKIDVIFDIDANGIIRVSAKDQSTGKEQVIKITADSGLSKSELENKTKEIGAEFAKKISKGEKIQSKQDYKEVPAREGEGGGLASAPEEEGEFKKKKSIFDIFKKKEG
ncbi:MAG: molecular chaperone DnaK [Candidatus Goldbacteria bacterium]|nr:molecular chaperone DnaK [Candidatus Goldiibacteriota bacterium]